LRPIGRKLKKQENIKNFFSLASKPAAQVHSIEDSGNNNIPGV
jgi:hypothetical protein